MLTESMTGLYMQINMEFGLLDFKKELSDCEETKPGATPWVNSIKKEYYSVLGLTEMEASERLGRFCRPMKYEPKLVHGSDDVDLKVETADPIITDTDEAFDTKHDCEICGAEHPSRGEFEFHVAAHKLWGKGNRLPSRLAENEENCGPERVVQTPSDQTDSQLKNSPREKKHTCKLCGVEYARKLNLNRHMRIHTGETPYTCEVCGKGFRRSDWLAKHMNMHKDKRQASPDGSKKRYACEHCEKTYQNKEYLKHHLRTHTGERPYQCAICEKRFYSENCRKIHLRSHSDARPYTCSECGHSFKRSGILNKHMRIHTGEMPYSCSSCSKTFRYKYSLTVHMKTNCC